MLSWITFPVRAIVELVKAAVALARVWIEGEQSTSKTHDPPMLCDEPDFSTEKSAAQTRMIRSDSIESTGSTASLTEESDFESEDDSDADRDEDEGEDEGLSAEPTEGRLKVRTSAALLPLFYQTEPDMFAMLSGPRTKKYAHIVTRLDSNNNKPHTRSSREIEREALRLLGLQIRDAKNREHRRRMATMKGSIPVDCTTNPRSQQKADARREAKRLLAAENRKHRRRLDAVKSTIGCETAPAPLEPHKKTV